MKSFSNDPMKHYVYSSESSRPLGMLGLAKTV